MVLSGLQTWPQMTSDLKWPLTLSTSEGSNVSSMTQVWFQSDFNFSNEAKFHFQPILKFALRWPLTLKCDLWPCQRVKVPMLQLFKWGQISHIWIYKVCFVHLTEHDKNVCEYSKLLDMQPSVTSTSSDIYINSMAISRSGQFWTKNRLELVIWYLNLWYYFRSNKNQAYTFS